MYALAAKDLSRDELQAVTAGDLRKESLDDVAEWITAQRVYRLRPQQYGRVYAELWPRYTPEQRAQARARVGRGVGGGLQEPLASRERAVEAAERYRAQREQLLRLGEELSKAQDPFKDLERRLRDAEERGDEAEQAAVGREVVAAFERAKDGLLRKHTDFVRLHDSLRALRVPRAHPPARARPSAGRRDWERWEWRESSGATGGGGRGAEGGRVGRRRRHEV
jgi:hypothetical protein